MKQNSIGDHVALDKQERRIIERLLKRGGASLVVANGGDTKITAYFNTERFRDSRIRHG